MPLPDPPIEIIARAVIRRADSVLLCKNRKKHYLFLPGGHVDPGESAPQALERELMEEAGLTVRAGDLLAIAEVRFHDGAKRHHEINLVFHVEHPHAGDGVVFHVEHTEGVPLHGRESGRVVKMPVDDESPPPHIASREDHIEFVWIDRSSIPDSDIRPACLRAWLGGLMEHPAQPEQSAPGAAHRVAWLSVDE